MCVHELCDYVCTVYLLWDVIYTVPVQEKLDEATRYTIRHLLQDVVGQIELHEALQALESVSSQVAVTQLREGVHSIQYNIRYSTYCNCVCSKNAYCLYPNSTV